MEDESEFEGAKGKKSNAQAPPSRPFLPNSLDQYLVITVCLEVAVSVGFRPSFATL